MPKYAKRRDSNDSDVTKGLPGHFRDLPLKVMDVSSYAGMLDRLVFLGDLGLFVEVKAVDLTDKSNEKVLTKREKKFKGPFFVVHTQQELMIVLAEQYEFAVAYTNAKSKYKSRNQ